MGYNSYNHGEQEKGLLTEFDAQVVRPQNTTGSVSIPILTTPVDIASIDLSIDDKADRVWLTANIGWVATANSPPGLTKVDVLWEIRKIGGLAPIYSARESSEAGFDNFKVTSLIHVDLDPISTNKEKRVSYLLSVRLVAGGTATVIGPITFTGAEIEGNTKNQCCE